MTSCSASRAIAADALAMLARLSGRWHRCCRRWRWRRASGLQCALSRSEVRFRVADARANAQAYWDSGEPRDKAGAYAIQGLGAVFIEELRGSYSGVMGLPLFETAESAGGVPLGDVAGRARTGACPNRQRGSDDVYSMQRRRSRSRHCR